MILDSVQSRRTIARTIIPSNVRALESKGLEVSDLDGIQCCVAGRVIFSPITGFWRFLDGSKQGYGASRLIPALAVSGEQIAVKPLDPMIEALRKPVKKKTEKPAAGRDNVPAELEATELHQHVESAAGSASSRLPAVWP